MREQYRTVTTPLALAIFEAHGPNSTLTVQDQAIIRASLYESYSHPTVQHRMKLLEEELREFLIYFE